MKKLLFIIILLTYHSAFAAAPVLFYSDIDSGPKTGWEGSGTKGAAVTIWGRNFGAATATSYLQVCGQQILSTNSTYIVSWNTTGVARGDKYIEFHLNSSMSDGAGTIQVVTSEGSSNTLAFTVRSGTIRFVDASTGSNGDDGLTVANAFQTILYCIDSSSAGDFCYCKATAAYTETNATGVHIRFDNQAGTSGNPISILAYPGEAPTIGNGTLASGFSQYNNPPTHGDTHDITIAKFIFDVTAIGVGSGQSTLPWYNFRVVGNTVDGATTQSWAGAIYFAYAYNIKIFGNRLNNCGYDRFDHSIYLNSHPSAVDSSTDSHDAEIAFNEISNQNSGSNIKVHPKDSSTVAKWDEVVIHSNYLHNSDNEVMEVGARVADIYFFNNLIVTIPDGTGSYPNTYPVINFTNQDSTAMNMRIYHNTFVDTTQDATYFVRLVDGLGCSVSFINNIIYTSVSGLPHELSTTWDGTVAGSYNMLYNITSIGSWDTSTLTSTDPSFVGGGDYSLQSGSDAIGAALYNSTITTVLVLPSAYSNARDYEGKLRGAAYDIGAIEYLEAQQSTPTASGGSAGSGVTMTTF